MSIIDVLNRDVIGHIISFLGERDLIRITYVCKWFWQTFPYSQTMWLLLRDEAVPCDKDGCYDPNGKGTLFRSRKRDTGRLHGSAYTVDAYGFVDFVFMYRDGLRYGTCFSWFKNGNIFYERNYRDDDRHGVFRRWSRDGKLVRECMYQQNTLVATRVHEPGHDIWCRNGYNRE